MTDTPNPMDAIEQAQAMRGVAEIIRSYYVALCLEGFTPAEAMTLTEGYQHALVMASPGTAQSPPPEER